MTDLDLKHKFLISMPSLYGSIFSGSITYLCDHSEHGALGVIVNQPLGISLGDILKQLQLEGEGREDRVFAGGPVQVDRGFVIHRPIGQWQSTIEVGDGICLTTSQDILQACAENKEPKEFLIALGYAGWSPGQLEKEIGENCWLVCPADDQILFHTPFDARYEAALAKLGVKPGQLSSQIGHA